MSEIEEDIDAKLRPGMMNAAFDCFSLNDEDPAVTGYTILRGNNTYPTEVISYVVRTDNNTFIEQSNALPEYYGQEETWQISRNDTSKYVIGAYGDWMTYVPVTRVNGEDRVKGGENTYGGLTSKTGVAGLDAWVNGVVYDQTSEDPCMWKDENGVDCALFNPYFSISATLPDYATWEYLPKLLRIWVKCDNIRYCDWVDGHIVNDLETPRENLTLLFQEYIDPDYYWDEELGEYVYDFDGDIFIGGPDSDICAFGATYTGQEETFEFIIRFYYDVQTNMPLKAGPSWMPSYCVVEKNVTWTVNPVITGVKEVGSEIEVGKTFYNVQGMASDKPFSGLNIVVTRYSDGSTKTSKMIQ